jgi:hypothetical protein
MGLSSLFMQDVVWRLASLDFPGKVIEGQFPATDLTENISANYAQLSTTGREQPILQYQNGELHSLTFGAKAWARHHGFGGANADNIDEFVLSIRRLPQRDPDLRRPEIFDFTVGDNDNLVMTCVVKSVGGVTYDRLRPLDGSLRGVSFRLELWRYDPFDAELRGSQNESLVIPRRTNESFELLAKKIYGDAELGEALRRRNPEKRIPVNGDLVRMPPKSKLTSGFALDPTSIALKTSDRTETLRRTFLTLRGKTYKSHLLGPDWGS